MGRRNFNPKYFERIVAVMADGKARYQKEIAEEADVHPSTVKKYSSKLVERGVLLKKEHESESDDSLYEPKNLYVLAEDADLSPYIDESTIQKNRGEEEDTTTVEGGQNQGHGQDDEDEDEDGTVAVDEEVEEPQKNQEEQPQQEQEQQQQQQRQEQEQEQEQKDYREKLPSEDPEDWKGIQHMQVFSHYGKKILTYMARKMKEEDREYFSLEEIADHLDTINLLWVDWLIKNLKLEGFIGRAVKVKKTGLFSEEKEILFYLNKEKIVGGDGGETAGEENMRDAPAIPPM